jgi:S1-C subfamily serine protease
LNNNASYTAKIIGTDRNSDLALLKIETEEELPYLAFGDSDRSAVGEWVLAVGNPFNLTSTVTAGIISAKSRSISTANNLSFIQTDAAVNPGNSGGALVNTKGELIGINTAIKSRTGSYVGYSFAIPSNTAKKVIEDLLEFGTVQRGILGISALRAESIEAIRRGLDEIEGVYISEVNVGSGAEIAGLKSGDIIKRVDGLPIKNFTALTGYLSAKRPGDQVEIIFERDDNQLSTIVTLTKNETADLNRLGLRVQNLNETLQKKFKRKEGVIITAASEYYKNYNLEGKVVIAIDGIKVSTIEDAIEASKENNTYRHALTVIDEEGNKETLIFN